MMSGKLLLVLGAMVGLANATELTPADWDEKTAGKTVFIKFLAPWCGHCKTMKPDWDKLIKEFEGSKTALIADVDCTTTGKDLCETHGVKGFPTLKWGDPSALEDYQGGRKFADLKKFADENLKPTCSPANIDLCDADKKKQIEDLQALDPKDLEKQITEKEKELADAEAKFKEDVDGLQKKYKQLQQDKEDTVKKLKDSGLGIMKAVKATKTKKKDEL